MAENRGLVSHFDHYEPMNYLDFMIILVSCFSKLSSIENLCFLFYQRGLQNNEGPKKRWRYHFGHG